MTGQQCCILSATYKLRPVLLLKLSFFTLMTVIFFLLNPSAIQGQEHSLTGQKVKIKKESQKVLNSACHPNLSHYHNLSKI